MNIFPSLKTIDTAWSAYWKSRAGRLTIVVTVGLVIPVFSSEIHFLNAWESREGAMIADKVLNFLTPVNFSIPIFFLLYAVIFGGIYHLLDDPDYLLKGFQAYMLMMVLRLGSIYFLPLQPPKGMILLLDPLALYFLSNKGEAVTKDLFFSGHTASIFIFYFAVIHPKFKRFIGVAGILVPIMLVWQHVHYTADVLAAPVISLFCIKAVEKGYNIFGLPFKSIHEPEIVANRVAGRKKAEAVSGP